MSGNFSSAEPDPQLTWTAMKFNNRGTRENPITDSDRFHLAVRQIVGKRLTFDELTGKSGSTATHFC